MPAEFGVTGAFTLTPDQGPPEPMASAARDGLVPGQVYHYEHGPEAGELSIATPLGSDEVVVVAIYPQQTQPLVADVNDESLRLTWLLDDAEAHDQHGHVGALPCLVADQWNLIQLHADEAAATLTLTTREWGSGWLQVIGPQPRQAEEAEPIDRVDTRRGTHSAYLYSRGNTLPYTCVPHGFNFLTPVTRASENSWPYQWHGHHGATPHLQALAFAHAPSPWIGNRSAFQIMPWVDHAMIDPVERQLAFSHDDEWARPDIYRVQLEHGITAEMTPTSRAGVFRFTFPDDRRAGVLLDLPEAGELTAHNLADGRVAFSGWMKPPAEPRPDRAWPAGYVYGEVTQRAEVRRAVAPRSIVRGLRLFGRRLDRGPLGLLKRTTPRPESLTITLTEGQVLEVKIATSFISVEQARRNLALEVGERGFDDVHAAARAEWADLLDRLEVEGGTPDQRAMAHTSVYRAYCWPNAHHENLGTADEPRWAYASPFRAPVGENTPTQTGCAIVDGQLMVNNGYWDTYRTAWPLYHLFTPQRAGWLLDGILQAYRDGGWMPRWTAPGYINLMVGTSSDTIFADAATHGIDFDEVTAFDSALKNALVISADKAVGRHGAERAQLGGWIDTGTAEALSWTFENSICDAAIARWAASLVERADELGVGERRAEFAKHAEMFTLRSSAYRHLFDDEVGFFQGRRIDGKFRRAARDFDPSVWGHDYTETNAWGMAFAAVHDVDGMIELYGGREAFVAKLDEAFGTVFESAPERYGHYSYSIQEMNEAQVHGFGMVAMSNQPAHHIPFLYAHAGRPDRTAEITRQMLDLLFVGGEIGQGYPGDEDNGEMSAWWLFAAMGFYPVFPGGGSYTLSSPLFDRLSWRRDDGTTLVITADGQPGPHVASVSVDGEPVDGFEVTVEQMKGDTHLHCELG